MCAAQANARRDSKSSHGQEKKNWPVLAAIAARRQQRIRLKVQSCCKCYFRLQRSHFMAQSMDVKIYSILNQKTWTPSVSSFPIECDMQIGCDVKCINEYISWKIGEMKIHTLLTIWPSWPKPGPELQVLPVAPLVNEIIKQLCSPYTVNAR